MNELISIVSQFALEGQVISIDSLGFRDFGSDNETNSQTTIVPAEVSARPSMQGTTLQCDGSKPHS